MQIFFGTGIYILHGDIYRHWMHYVSGLYRDHVFPCIGQEKNCRHCNKGWGSSWRGYIAAYQWDKKNRRWLDGVFTWSPPGDHEVESAMVLNGNPIRISKRSGGLLKIRKSMQDFEPEDVPRFGLARALNILWLKMGMTVDEMKEIPFLNPPRK